MNELLQSTTLFVGNQAQSWVSMATLQSLRKKCKELKGLNKQKEDSQVSPRALDDILEDGEIRSRIRERYIQITNTPIKLSNYF